MSDPEATMSEYVTEWCAYVGGHGVTFYYCGKAPSHAIHRLDSVDFHHDFVSLEGADK